MGYLDAIKKSCVDNIQPCFSKIKNELSEKSLALVTKIQQFVDKHFTGILFSVCALGTLYLAPQLFLVGVVAGLVATRLWEKYAQDNEIRLVTHLKAVMESSAFIGTALTLNHASQLVMAVPLVGGIVAGNVLYNAFRKFVPAKPIALEA
jgi:hypothetical protein